MVPSDIIDVDIDVDWALPCASGALLKYQRVIYLNMQRKMQSLDAAAEAIIRRGPATPDELANTLGVSWATANAALLRLASRGLATVSRKGRVNVYFLGVTPSSSSHTPSWARPTSLEQLSSELSEYFPSGVSASELIRRERRRG